MANTQRKSTAPRGRECNFCGQAVRQSDNYCPACGNMLEDNSATQANDAHHDEGGNCQCGCGCQGTCHCGNDGYYSFNSHSRVVAALLAFFFGWLGLHNFYLGFYTRAVCQLVISLIVGALSCGLASLAVGIWAFIEGVLYLASAEGFRTDAHGIPLRD